VGALYGKVSNQAFTLRSRFQRWVDAQVTNPKGCGPGGGASPAPGAGSASAAAGPGTPVPGPTSAVQDALQWIQEGCALASQRQLALPACGPESLATFRAHNASLSGLYGGIACSIAGPRVGTAEPCVRGAVDPSLERTETYALLGEFQGEVADTAYDAFAVGEGLTAGSVGLQEAGAVALQLGNATAGASLLSAAGFLEVAASQLFASGYDLFRIGAIARRWEALVTWQFNAERRRLLDLAVGSSTGGAAAATGSSSAGALLQAPGSAPATLPAFAPVTPPTADPVDFTEARDSRTSDAGRARPAFGWLWIWAWRR
jgi:hypothetical protein